MKIISGLFFFLIYLQSSAENYWGRSFGPGSNEYVLKVIASQNGGWITAGYTEGYGNTNYNMHIIKWDSFGEIEWQRVVGGPDHEYAYGVAEDAAGNVYAAGKIIAAGVAAYYDILVVKFNSGGNVIWQKVYGGTLNDIANAIIVNTSNKIIVAGGTSSYGAGGMDAFIFEIDSLGNTVWSRTYGTPGDEYINAIAPVHDGTYLLAGRTSGFGDNHGYVVRIDNSGDSLWTNAYDIGTHQAAQLYDATELSGTSIVYTGLGNEFYGNMVDMKTDLSGNLIYSHTSSYIADCGYGITPSPGGGYVVCGYYSNYGTYPILTKMDSSGNKEWDHFVQDGYASYGNGRSFVRNPDGSFVITGDYNTLCNSHDAVIIRTDSAFISTYYKSIVITSSAGTNFCSEASVNTILTAPAECEEYQWFLNANLISGATSQTYHATKSGIYACLIEYSEGFNISFFQIRADSILSKPVINPSGILNTCANSGSTRLSCNSSQQQFQWLLNGNPIPGATGNFYNASVDGDYSLTVYNNCDSATSDPVQVFLSQAPHNLSIISNKGFNLCAASGQACTFSVLGESISGNILWILNDTGIVATGYNCYPTVAGNYKVVVTNDCGSATSGAVTLNLSAAPVAPVSSTGHSSLTVFSASGVNYYCGSDTLFTNNLYPATYTWKRDNIPVGSSYLLVIFQTGTYTVTISDSCGSVTSDPFIVSGVAGNDSLIVTNTSSCMTIKLTAPLNAPYEWYRNGNSLLSYGQNYSAYLAGNYYCTFQPQGCSVPVPSNTVSLGAALGLPLIQASPFTHVCSGNILLTVNRPGASYQWKIENTPIGGATNQSYSASQSGKYYCIVTLPGCVPDSTQINIWIGQATISSALTVVCPSYGTWLNINGNYLQQIQWRLNGVNINGANNYNYQATQGGIYDCTITDSCGTYNTNSINLPAFPTTPGISPSGVIPLCDGSSMLLDATFPGSTYQWQHDNTNIPGATDSVFIAGPDLVDISTYGILYLSVKIINAGCNITTPIDTVILKNNLTNSIYASSTTEWCGIGSVQLNARSIPGTYLQWYNDSILIPGATDTSYTTSQSGKYSAYLTDSMGCETKSNVINVRNDALHGSINSNGPLYFCEGNSVTLTLIPPTDSYQWYRNGMMVPGATMQSYIADTKAFITVNYEDSSGCYGLKGILVEEANNNLSTITSHGNSYCAGDSAFLYDSGNGQWYCNGTPIPNATSSLYYAKTTGDYYKINIGLGGCPSYTDTVTLSFDSILIATITSSETSLCNASYISLKANFNQGFNYQWQRNGIDIPGAIYFTHEAYSSGIYTCEVTGSCGNAVSNAITISSSLPATSISASGQTSFCMGDSVLLTAASINGITYQWRKNSSDLYGATNAACVAYSSGNYYVVIADSNGCVNSSNTIEVNVDLYPLVAVAASSGFLCAGAGVTLTANSFIQLSYQWMLNSVAIPGATNSNYAATAVGAYQCAVSNSCGNSVSDSVAIVDGTPLINLGNDTTLCTGQNILFDAGITHTSYLWQDGSATQTFDATSAIADTLLIFVTVTDFTGCSNSDSVTAIFEVCSGISISSDNKVISINPNPAQTYFIISGSLSVGITRLRIFNPLGEIVYAEILSGKEKYVIRPNLSQGLYFVNVICGEKNFLSKLVIE